MKITKYQAENRDEVIALIKQTIKTVNKQDYSSNQVEAWADFNPETWAKGLENHLAVIVTLEERIVGFADMDDTGYLDHLYVHFDYQRRGVAQLLLSFLEKNHQGKTFTTYASKTAQPFFEVFGYDVIKENQLILRGETFINYYMKKEGGK